MRFAKAMLGLVQMPLHSCAEPNLIKFNFRATLEQRLVQMAYLRRTLFGKPVVTIFDENSEFKNYVQIEKLWLTFRCYRIFREANSNSSSVFAFRQVFSGLIQRFKGKPHKLGYSHEERQKMNLRLGNSLTQSCFS